MTTKDENVRAWRRSGVREPLPPSPALIRSLRLVSDGTKLHENAARPLLARDLIRRGEHRDWLTDAGREALAALEKP